MKSKQGNTLTGIALTQGNVDVTSGVFPGATGAKCIGAGNIIVTWHDDNTETLTFAAGREEHIDCKSIQVSTGTWVIGYD